MKVDRVKGHLDLLLLGVLDAEPGHGYAVISALRERSDGALDLAEGAVYPALHRLEAAGLLASDWQPVGGRRRRMYRLTPDGRRALAAERSSWTALVSAVEAVLRPAHLAVGPA
jgi:PadR family transcriptional regulator, regulatory protein PadR